MTARGRRKNLTVTRSLTAPATSVYDSSSYTRIWKVVKE